MFVLTAVANNLVEVLDYYSYLIAIFISQNICYINFNSRDKAFWVSNKFATFFLLFSSFLRNFSILKYCKTNSFNF